MTAESSRHIVWRSHDRAALAEAFSFIEGLCQTRQIDRIALVVPAKRYFRYTMLADFMGKAIAARLLKGKTVRSATATAR